MRPLQAENRLVWLDLEMTGLDPEKHTILEIATAITDNDLQVLAEGPCLTIHHSEEELSGMDPWCVEQHGKSGLTERARRSSVTAAEAQARTLEFVAQYCLPAQAPLCGNTIGQDRRFLVKYMPRLHDYFHYRSIDVSSVKELVQRWYPSSHYVYSKNQQHMAREDVRDSIAELAYYRKTVFR